MKQAIAEALLPRTHPFAAALRTGLVAGTLASLASTLVLALAGRRETGSYAAPTNATSHWVWDREAFRIYHPTWRHTVPGYAIHHATSTFWAVLYAWAHANRPHARSLPAALAGAGVAAATACAVDYTLTPKRLTPGFEEHLSKPAMTVVYAAFGIGLAVGGLLANRLARRDSP
jgi:hypothetical protein